MRAAQQWPSGPALQQAQEVYDVTGAGDTVIGVLAATLAAGNSLEEACYFANAAAGVVVGLGTSCAGLSMAVSGCVQAESFCSASLRVRVRSATLLTTVRSARMPAAVAANTMARQNRYSPFSLKNCLMWFIFPRPLLV